MMWRHALTMGAAVLAAVPIALGPVIPACAVEPMSPVEWLKYYNISSSDADAITLWTEDPFWPAYYTAVMNIIQLPYIDGVPINPVDYGGNNTICGKYLRNGELHVGSVTLWGRRTYQNGGTAVLPFFVGDDCSISVSITPNFDPLKIHPFYCDLLFSNHRPYIYCSIERGAPSADVVVTGAGFSPGNTMYNAVTPYQIYIMGGRTDALEPAEMPMDVSTVCQVDYVSGQLLGDNFSIPDLPTSTLYTEITQENAMDYIHDVLNPWALEQSPSIAPYLLQDAPPPPEYPVQETWTEDADWPDGNLLPTIPAASYTVDIPEAMTEGAAFWWRCLGVLFDGLGITAIVVGLLALGIVLYFVLR